MFCFYLDLDFSMPCLLQTHIQGASRPSCQSHQGPLFKVHLLFLLVSDIKVMSETVDKHTSWLWRQSLPVWLSGNGIASHQHQHWAWLVLGWVQVPVRDIYLGM